MEQSDFPYAFFLGLPRQGPGSDVATRKAFARVQPYIPHCPKVIDFGCGTGAQTLTLACLPQLAGGEILAVDSASTFVNALDRTLAAKKPGCVVLPRVGDMALPKSIEGITPGAFDLIWSESAAYSIGFANALDVWRPLLREGRAGSGGCLVVSELTWFTTVPQKRAPEAWAFWNAYYPDMRPAEKNLPLFEAAGYKVLAHFPLPVKAWYEGYYGPVERALNAGVYLDAEMQTMLRQEMAMFAKYSRWYGYTFYCAQAV